MAITIAITNTETSTTKTLTIDQPLLKKVKDAVKDDVMELPDGTYGPRYNTVIAMFLDHNKKLLQAIDNSYPSPDTARVAELRAIITTAQAEIAQIKAAGLVET